jgi:multisubunit Na+/H+ antiporter MnhB subunit
MTGALLFDVLLCLLLVGVALGAVLARALFTAVVFFVVYGLSVAVAWARLGAVDVALAEAAIGAGLTGVLLVRSLARLPVGRLPRRAEAWRLAAAVACTALFVGLAAVVLGQGGAPGLVEPVARNIAATGLGNPVTAVLLNFRGYDTLLETVVLLCALLAIWSLAPDAAWNGRPGLRDHARPDGVLASFARLLPPVGLLVGVHLFWAGADAPGGAFQAGTILASVWLLATMAGIAQPGPVTGRSLRWVIAAGPLMFLAVAIAALPAGGFLVFPPEQAKLLVLAVEAALTLSVAATGGLLVLGPPLGAVRPPQP